MKTLALLTLLILTSNSFGQGVWREVVTPNDSIWGIDFFPDGSGYIMSENRFGKHWDWHTYDTIYFSAADSKNWEVFANLYEYENVFYGWDIQKIEFLTKENWYIIDRSLNTEEGSHQGYVSLRNKGIPDTSFTSSPFFGMPFPTHISSGIFQFAVSDDQSVYCTAYIGWQTDDSFFYWDKDLHKWVNPLALDSSILLIEYFGLNRKNKDCIIVYDDTTSGPENIFFIPNSQFDNIQRRASPISGYIQHVVDSTWFIFNGNHYSLSTNNGTTWSNIDSVNNVITGIDILENGFGFLVTRSTDGKSSLYKTNDFGRLWNIQFENQPFIIYDISTVDSLTAYFTNGKLFKTTDGGGSILLSAKEKNKQVSTEGIFVYPNPVVRNTCQLRHPIELSDQPIIVHDMLGRRIQYIFPAVGTDNTSLNVTQLPSGVYYVAMGNERLKLIKD